MKGFNLVQLEEFKYHNQQTLGNNSNCPQHKLLTFPKDTHKKMCTTIFMWIFHKCNDFYIVQTVYSTPYP